MHDWCASENAKHVSILKETEFFRINVHTSNYICYLCSRWMQMNQLPYKTKHMLSMIFPN